MFLRLLCLLLFPLPCFAAAQDSTAKWDGRRRFAEARTGKPFFLQGALATIDGRDSVRLGRKPAFVSFGFYLCGPCRAAMPHFIALARRRPDVQFVYVTYDSKATVQQELADKGETFAGLPPNLGIVRMSDDAIRQRGLVMGYPTRYFLDTDGTVRVVTNGGRINHMESEVAEWEAALSVLH